MLFKYTTAEPVPTNLFRRGKKSAGNASSCRASSLCNRDQPARLLRLVSWTFIRPVRQDSYFAIFGREPQHGKAEALRRVHALGLAAREV
jgi:hypothetical protein